MASRPQPTDSRHGGFTLIELLISMAVMAEVMAVAYIMFDVNTRIGRTQLQVADLQQNQRIAQHELVRSVRMAGRGGLPQNLAVRVENAVSGKKIGNDGAAPAAVDDTDVLTVRGIFGSPIFQITDTGAASNLTLNPPPPAAPATGTLRISNMTRDEIPQPLAVLTNLGNRPEPLLMVSTRDDSVFAIVEITNVSAPAPGQRTGEETVTVSFTITANRYAALAPWPAGLTSVGFAGVLEEYRYYVREEYAVEGDDASDLTPKLSQARMYPGTEDIWDGDVNNAKLDIAENILDFQVVLGYDLDNDDVLKEDSANPAADEWRYNDSGDNPDDATWQAGQLFYARVTTLARTDRPDRGYEDRALTALEDRDYSEPTHPSSPSEITERQHRRRQQRTTVDLRNVG